MTNPSPATQTRVLADLCDAIDPALDLTVRDNAAVRAHHTHPDWAYGAAIGILRDLVADIARINGPTTAADLLERIRIGCGHAIGRTEAP